MKSKDNWLNEMMDAALSDTPDTLKDPDFQNLRNAPSYKPHHKRRVFISAAAAILAVSIAVPAGIIKGKQIQTRNLIHEQNALFVEELIGGTLFDEGLTGDSSGSWIFETEIDTEFFDI